MDDKYFFLQGRDDAPLVEALHLDLIEAGTHLSVSARDEMFNVFYYGRGESQDIALHLYLESGKRIWSTLRRVLERHFGELSRIDGILDFASGYGRVTRHIVTDISPERVWITEIDPAAVSFQEETFGVHGLLSSTCPERFSPPRTFSAVLVSSLFTHLPETRFLSWLDRLLSLVRDNGLLAFSVHDISLAPFPAQGAELLFHAASESGSLSTAEYGSTWVTEGYVRRALERLGAPAPLQVVRIPRGLASYQDLYVITKSGKPTDEEMSASCLGLRGGADGFIEECHLNSSRELLLEGWVIDRFTKFAAREVDCYLDEVLIWKTDALMERPEVAASFPGDAGVGQGFRARITLPPHCDLDEAILRIAAVGSDGFISVLAEGSLHSLLLRAALFQGHEREQEIERQREAQRRSEERFTSLLAAEEARHRQTVLSSQSEIAALEARISAMRASKFWKLRDRWFAVKRLLRLTEEE